MSFGIQFDDIRLLPGRDIRLTVNNTICHTLLHICLTAELETCRVDRCGDNGECVQRADGGIECTCDSGWGGRDCSVDIADNCLSEPCENGGVCSDGINTFSCDCPPGWTGDTCENGKLAYHSKTYGTMFSCFSF